MFGLQLGLGLLQLLSIYSLHVGVGGRERERITKDNKVNNAVYSNNALDYPADTIESTSESYRVLRPLHHPDTLNIVGCRN